MLLDTFPPVIPTPHVSLSDAAPAGARRTGCSYIRNIYEPADHRTPHPARPGQRSPTTVARGEVVPSELRELYVEWNFMARRQRATCCGRGAAASCCSGPRSCTSRSRASARRTAGTRSSTDGFELLRVPGNHDNLVLEPNASMLVRKLRDTLDARQTLPGDESLAG